MDEKQLQSLANGLAEDLPTPRGPQPVCRPTG